ncbi:ATP-binding cassette domain-containing protein [Roseomonas sp. E05]|uniref:ATP-binding cassette domain-containing protein n=1 Tax=Roseomonas sp. E05 TaxID=3046310 RepID=UPI0024BA5526|nr:ATP-binding cassette domain-containing protein [Roseomonas sp. E05]MDJ0387965.1 ATP-binding cassette domain-containing protein [Roseomonas sp. E05]
MLEVSRLSIGFRRPRGLWRREVVPALRDVSLRVRAGEVLAVIGASGAGKSLLAQAILGLLPPNAAMSGEMRFQGAPLDAPRLRGRRVALVPQSIAWLDPLVRAGRQVEWAAGRAGLPAPDRAPAAAAALARFGLGMAAARRFPHQLSGGMARRAMLAIAALGEAELLIADEPTNGLDPENAARVLGHLRARADAGRGVLVISHDLAAVLPLADRVAILREGALQETAPAAAFQGNGMALASPYARALWQALPEVGFLPAEAG